MGHTLERLEPRTFLSTYYVSPAGSDSAAGTAAAPLRTLQRAADRVAAGDVVVVRAGRYAGFTLYTSGSASSPITFAAEAGAIVDQRNSKTDDGINLQGASYVVVRGFTVSGVPRAGIRSAANTGVQIIGNTVDSCGTWGILTGFSQNILIENNVTSRTVQQHGIYVGNSADNPVIRGNTSWGNYQCGIQINSDASLGGDGVITGAIVEKNRVYGNGMGGGAAINLDGVNDSNINDNLLYDNHASGISLHRIDGATGASNNLIVNNTVVMSDDAAAPGRYALNIRDGSTNNVALNNILYSYYPLSGGRGSIGISPDSLSGFVSDYNIVNDTNGFSAAATMNFAQWKATGRDAHSLLATPAQIFSNAAASDFSLSAGSAAIDRGTSSRIPASDIVNAARSYGSGVDIGAYEWNSSPAPPPPPPPTPGPTPIPGPVPPPHLPQGGIKGGSKFGPGSFNASELKRW